MAEVLRVANCSGFYGDRLSAMREMVTGTVAGDPVDVVTGDYLAELTMLILGRDRLKDPGLGYARTFVRQLEDCLGTLLERGITVVANAGGLNPRGLAARVEELASGLGLAPTVAYVDGDDLMPRAEELGIADALTANAYLGGFGIADALREGADIVVTGRVTDASLVLGPAAAHFSWTPTAYDELAGAVVAGHVIECGTQATGGNFSGFLDLPRDSRPLGFPVAELAGDGSSVITKCDGTGGMVTVDTVTAQLVYEIQGPAYLGPDVTTDLTSVALAQDGPDRVAVHGVRGTAPPERLKVCVNQLGGFRNSVELVLTGLDLDAKEAWVVEQMEARLQTRPASVTWSRGPEPRADADTEEGASRLLRCVVKDQSAEVVGRSFSAAAVELALASYPGFTMTAPPGGASPYGVYRADYVDRDVVVERVHVGGRTLERPSACSGQPAEPVASAGPSYPGGPTVRVPLGRVVHARSGDKGGDANLGLWVRPCTNVEAAAAWLHTVDADFVRRLLPECADLDVEVHRLPNLRAVNVVIHGLLGDGVAASTRFDPQAKGLGEWARSRMVDVPEEVL